MTWQRTTPADLMGVSGSYAIADFDGVHALVLDVDNNEARRLTYPATLGTAAPLASVSTCAYPRCRKAATDKVIASFSQPSGTADTGTVVIVTETTPPGIGTRDESMSSGGAGHIVHTAVLSATRLFAESNGNLTLFSMNLGAGTLSVLDTNSASMDDMVELTSAKAVTIKSNVHSELLDGTGDTISISDNNLFGSLGFAEKGSLAPIDSTHVLLIYNVSTSGDLMGVVLTVSGTTITPGTPVTLDSGVNATPIVKQIGSSSTYGIVYNAGSGSYFRTVSVSGTTVTDNGDTLTIDSGRNVSDVSYYNDGADKLYAIFADGYYSILSPASAPAEFWYGANEAGIAKQCDLDFSEIANPSCMAVRDDGTVFVGAADGGAVVVEKLLPADYTTPIDITGSLATADPITALETT